MPRGATATSCVPARPWRRTNPLPPDGYPGCRLLSVFDPEYAPRARQPSPSSGALMNDYTVPPDPSMPPSAAPPPPPPPAKSTPWGKIALFGGIGCLVIGLIVAGILVVFYLIGRDQVETYGTTDGGG